MSEDLFKREDAIETIHNYWKKRLDTLPTADIQQIDKILEHNKTLCNFIEAIPSADRPQGEWKPFDLTWGRSIWYCTACEESTEVPCDIWTHKPIYKYCPNCGADMRGDNDGKDIQSADE